MSLPPDRRDIGGSQQPDFSPDGRAHLDELIKRLPGYADRAYAVPPGMPGSIEWLGGVGKYWTEAREKQNLNRPQFSRRIGVPSSDLMFFEIGLAGPDVALSSLPRRYAETLGKPELYDRYRERFNIREVDPIEPDEPIDETTQLQDFKQKLTPYYAKYLMHLRKPVEDPESPSNPDKMLENGRRFRSIREEVKLSRALVAQMIGTEDPVQLAAFEGGIVPLSDLPEGYPQKLSQVLKVALDVNSDSSSIDKQK